MERYRAEGVCEGENYFLELHIRAKQLRIPLTEDKPKDIMIVFNDLIMELKKGNFQLELQDHGQDLYTQISKEYISQLNEELASVYNELNDYGMLETE